MPEVHLPVFQFSYHTCSDTEETNHQPSPWNGKNLTAALKHQHLSHFVHLFFMFNAWLFCELQIISWKLLSLFQ